MSNPVTVVAVIRARPGKGPAVIDTFREVSPLVHREPGCELYAAHLEQGGDTVVMVERWTTRADLEAHSQGAAIARGRGRRATPAAAVTQASPRGRGRGSRWWAASRVPRAPAPQRASGAVAGRGAGGRPAPRAASSSGRLRRRRTPPPAARPRCVPATRRPRRRAWAGTC